MNIATLDLAFAQTAEPAFERLSFMQPRPLAHAAALVWDAGALMPQLRGRFERLDPAVLGVQGSESLLATSRHWRKEFNHLLAQGGTIVVLVPSPQAIGVHTFQEVMPYDVLEPLLPLRVATAAHEGGAPICRAGDPFHAFFQQLGHIFEPAAVLAAHPGIPILQDGAGRTFAAYHNPTPGRLLLLPALAGAALARPEGAALFFSALQRCIERLGHNTHVNNAPWLSNYRTPEEQGLFARHAECLRQIGQLQEKLNLLEADINQGEFFKQLLGGEGRGTSLAIAECSGAKARSFNPIGSKAIFSW